MSAVRGLIFDCDGVLVDSEKFSCGAWLPVLRRRGIEVELSDIEAFIGQSDQAVLEHYRARGAQFPPDILAEREQEYFDLARGHLQSFVGLREALEELRRRDFPVAVASSGDLAKIRFSLEEVGLLEFFPILCSAVEVQRGKPAPDLFLLAVRRLGLAPEACAVVEDAVPGLQAARAAGMKAIGFPSSHPEVVLREAGAQAVLGSYAELLELLG
ncbi:MAG: HAD family phosphatase [Candidatus Latescibacteria bacterium]|nr:HAD family phosphatase [Candidatus Latescibacterota bacterium]